MRDSIEVAFGEGPETPIIVQWPHRGPVSENWGDKLNPVLVKLVSGRRAIPRPEVLNLAGRPVHYVIGSGLGAVTDPKAVIWGTGFLRYDQVPLVRPKKIAAVRGPLSRQKYLDAGIDCTDLYGDPALLYPLFYKPSPPKKYTLGVIPHFREKQLPVFRALAEQPGVKIIDIQGGLEEVVDGALACDVIASSSLHGLIIADAYKIPSVWIRASQLPKGDYFKFRDYFMSVGRSQLDPLMLDRDRGVQEILDRAQMSTIEIDLERLLEACPFRNNVDA